MPGGGGGGLDLSFLREIVCLLQLWQSGEGSGRGEQVRECEESRPLAPGSGQRGEDAVWDTESR